MTDRLAASHTEPIDVDGVSKPVVSRQVLDDKHTLNYLRRSALNTSNSLQMDISAFEKQIKSVPKIYCGECHRLIRSKPYYHLENNLCALCYRSVIANSISPLSWHNNNMDPGVAPPCLQILSVTETKLVSQIHPYMKILRLPAGGQFAEKGQSICIPIPIQDLCKTLPRMPDDAGEVVIYPAHSKSYFQAVKPKKVFDALEWLMTHNPLYRDIQLNCNLYDEQDPVETSDVHTVGSFETVALTPADYTVPLGKQDDDRIRLRMPRIANQPVNIFSTPNVEELAFPELYPFG
jgi:hypothetical protein